ncbi:hypothetical protein YC2023_072654 [Brassica napus]
MPGLNVKLELFNWVSAGHCKTKNQICGQHFKLISKIFNPSQLLFYFDKKLESYGEDEAWKS